jgi:hypothetical protein
VTTVRNAVITSHRQRGPIVAWAELPESVQADATSVDPVGRRVLAAVAADAFVRLPARWRMVLWHTEIEGESPARLAPQLGLTANGVAALACRAREACGRRIWRCICRLRNVALARTRATNSPPGSVVGNISHRSIQRVNAHLDNCADCTAVATELASINRGLGTATSAGTRRTPHT